MSKQDGTAISRQKILDDFQAKYAGSSAVPVILSTPREKPDKPDFLEQLKTRIEELKKNPPSPKP